MTRKGMAMVITHGLAAKQLLAIDWDHVIYTPPKIEGRHTVAQRTGPLPVDEAMRVLAGNDPRPLLVLRECDKCNGTDLALLRADKPNERTLLLTGFFHCVKLPTTVLQPDHPFRLLFEGHGHLFLANADGSGRVDFDGRQTQSQLWRAMRQLLDRPSFRVNPAVNRMQEVLAQLDRLDELETEALAQLDRELQSAGAKGARVPALQKQLREYSEQRRAIMDEIRELRAAAIASATTAAAGSPR
jgi:hypothetical protein